MNIIRYAIFLFVLNVQEKYEITHVLQFIIVTGYSTLTATHIPSLGPGSVYEICVNCVAVQTCVPGVRTHKHGVAANPMQSGDTQYSCKS